jgi:hypothetical protein
MGAEVHRRTGETGRSMRNADCGMRNEQAEPSTERRWKQGTREEAPAIAGASRPAKERPPPNPEPFHPREKPTAQRKMGVRGQGGRELVWGPIPSRLHPSKNADCRTPRGYPNAEWPNVEWPNQASADPHAVGDLYHLPRRRARREYDRSVRGYDGTKVRGRRQMTNGGDSGGLTNGHRPGCRLNVIVLALQAAVPGSAASPPRRGNQWTAGASPEGPSTAGWPAPACPRSLQISRLALALPLSSGKSRSCHPGGGAHSCRLGAWNRAR